MKLKCFILGVVFLAGCAGEDAKSEHKISDKAAIAIAKQYNTMKYDTRQKITVERIENRIIVTFPIYLPGGGFGPDYAAKIFLDAETGEFIGGLGGS